MPVFFTRDDARRLISVMVTDPYAIDDFVGLLERQHAEGAWAYATLHDFRSVSILPSAADVHLLMQHVGRIGNDRQRGPVGLAIRPDPRRFQDSLSFLPVTAGVVDVEVLL